MEFSSLKLKAPKELPLAAELVRREHGAAIQLHWAGAKQTGIYRGEFEVIAVDAEDAVAARLPWAVEIVPAVTAFPPSLCVEAPVASPWTRRLSIESRRDLIGAPSLRWSEEATGKAIQAQVTKDSARVFRVELSGKVPEGREQEALTIVIGDQSISVPIRFFQARRE